MEKIDSCDRILLEALQENGRASNVELSDKTGLSAPQCYRRARRLETDGIIRGYTARINPTAIGLEVIAYVSVKRARVELAQMKELEQRLRAIPEIIECYATTGDFDYLLKVATRDLASLAVFINGGLTQIDGIATTSSVLCLQEIKATGPLPIFDNSEPSSSPVTTTDESDAAG